MLSANLIIKLFDAANMQRWNDQLRPVELRELDKQAHKMVIAYVLGKFHEKDDGFNWQAIIQGGFFEFLQRLIITDLKPQLFHAIKADKEKYKELNNWVIDSIKPILEPFSTTLLQNFQTYIQSDDTDDINRRILSAAHFYATKWEFDIIERINPDGYEIKEIHNEITSKLESFNDLKGMQGLSLHSDYRHFVDLCGQLRFQVRWSHLHRVPRTSVLGHMLIVAMITYLLTLELDACDERIYNNYFTGLFHDLPEVLTRDVINPVKTSSKGLSDLIKDYESKQMKKIYRLIPLEWHADIKMFTENEFSDIVTLNGKIKIVDPDTINKKYNENKFQPRDGELVRGVDHLAAFLEAQLAIHNGIHNQTLINARDGIIEKYKSKKIAGIDFGALYKQIMKLDIQQYVCFSNEKRTKQSQSLS